MIFHNLAYVSNHQRIDDGSHSGTYELSTADLAAATGKRWTVLY